MSHFIVAILAVVIIYCLGSAAYYLISGKKRPGLMLRALTWRITVSIVLFCFILLAYSLGWIKPHPAKFLLKLEKAQASVVK